MNKINRIFDIVKNHPLEIKLIPVFYIEAIIK